MNRYWMAAAGTLFWLAWALMPGVGVTDPAQIFALVSAHRPFVAVSVLVQLISAMCYAPAVVAFASHPDWRRLATVRWGAALLAIGAMGSAADAVLHLLAYAMTAPN